MLVLFVYQRFLKVNRDLIERTSQQEVASTKANVTIQKAEVPEKDNENNDKVRNLMLLPDIPVGGRLVHFLPEWEK